METKKSPKKTNSRSRSGSISKPHHLYKITPTLAFLYQILNKENRKFEIVLNFYSFVDMDHFFQKYFDMIDRKKFSHDFTYEDAIECSNNIDSPKWRIVEQFMNLFRTLHEFKEIDVPFLLEIFKKEAIELQKGNLTFIHSKSVGFFVLDIISKLITGSYEGYRQKCQRDEKNSDEKALEIYNKLNFDSYYPGYVFSNINELNEAEILNEIWKDKSKRRNDNTPDIRSRVISCNITLLNNAFNTGESTLEFLFNEGGIGFPTRLIIDLGLSNQTTKKINLLSLDMYKIATNMIDLYSIPIDKIDKYVYLAQAYGYKDTRNPNNIYDFYDIYLGEAPWKEKFIDMYIAQVRIIDLCLNKYGYEDGVRITQMIDIEDYQLNEYLKKLEDIVMNDNELLEKISERIDQTSKRKKNPLKTIKSVTRTVQKDFDASVLLRYIFDTTSDKMERIPEIEKIVLDEALKTTGYQKDYKKHRKMMEIFEMINQYANQVVKGRWKEAEEMLIQLKDDKWINDYIKEVLSKYPERIKEYEDYLMKKDFPRYGTLNYLNQVLIKVPERWLNLEKFIEKGEKEYQNAIQAKILAKDNKEKEEAQKLLDYLKQEQYYLGELRRDYEKILSLL